MEILCPSCRSRIPADDLNVSTDIALCRACDKPFRISEAVGSAPADPQLLATPPSGAWFDPLPDGFRAGASTRSWMALFIVPFTCVWSGGSLFGIYGTQIVHGRFNVGMSLFRSSVPAWLHVSHLLVPDVGCRQRQDYAPR